MRLNPEDLIVHEHPKKPQAGMQAGAMPNGIRLVHKPTDTVVEISYHRSQIKNKEAAVAVMELLIDDA